jgi:hypothetical protein
MRSRDWIQALEEQRAAHQKVLFTVTELANLAGAGRNALQVQLSRLRRQGVVLQYARRLYGLPGAVRVEDLLPAIDSHAYVTGIWALHRHQLITQVPTTITCFTDRRSPRARFRSTPLGRFEFACVRSDAYSPPASGVLAEPEQALCDFVYTCRRAGVEPGAQATFRHLDRLRGSRLRSVARRYPSTISEEVEKLVAAAGGPRVRGSLG